MVKSCTFSAVRHMGHGGAAGRWLGVSGNEGGATDTLTHQFAVNKWNRRRLIRVKRPRFVVAAEKLRKGGPQGPPLRTIRTKNDPNDSNDPNDPNDYRKDSMISSSAAFGGRVFDASRNASGSSTMPSTSTKFCLS